ncbi:uncharacterized protein LOC120335366 [Styela clava]
MSSGCKKCLSNGIIIPKNVNSPLDYWSTICPYAPPVAPGISVAIAKKTQPMPGMANYDDSDHDTMCGNRMHRCPSGLFRAKAFCANQQAMVDSLREKVERYRSEIELTIKKEITTETSSSNTFIRYKSKKKRGFKIRGSKSDVGGDMKLCNDQLGQEKPNIIEKNSEPDKAQGDLARARMELDIAIKYSKTENSDADKCDTKSKKSRNKLRSKAWKLKNDADDQNLVTPISVPSFNARMGLFEK